MSNIGVVVFVLSVCFIVVFMVMLYFVLGGKFQKIIKSALSFTIVNKKIQNATGCNTTIDYNSCSLSVKERIICVTAAGGVVFIMGYTFYRSFAISLILLPMALIYPRIRRKEIISKRKGELNIQFREALYSISSSLSAGKSIEMSFRDAEKELSIQYPDCDAYILKELRQINKRVEMNETIEEALADFAARSHLEDIRNFAEVFAICKRTGGNLVQVVKNTAEIISEKIDVKQEINILLTEKKLEHKVLNLMPVFIVILLSTSAEEFMAPVFTEIIGKAAMTLSLILFGIAYLISKKIMDIEV